MNQKLAICRTAKLKCKLFFHFGEVSVKEVHNVTQRNVVIFL